MKLRCAKNILEHYWVHSQHSSTAQIFAVFITGEPLHQPTLGGPITASQIYSYKMFRTFSQCIF